MCIQRHASVKNNFKDFHSFCGLCVCVFLCIFMVKNKNELINFFLFLLLLAYSLDVYVYIKNSLKRSLLLPLMHTLIQYMRMEMSWDVMTHECVFFQKMFVNYFMNYLRQLYLIKSLFTSSRIHAASLKRKRR